MKILYLLTQDLQSPSGLGRYWPLARALAGRNHEVSIAALHPAWDQLVNKSSVQEGVNIEYVARMHVVKVENQKIYYPPLKLIGVTLQATWALSKAAIGSSVDLIHVGKPHPMNGTAGWLASRIKGIPLVVDCDDYEAGSNRFSGSWQRKGVGFFEKSLPRSADLITTNTHYMKEMLSGWGCAEENICYLSNGVDKERFRSPGKDQIEQLRAQLGLTDKRVVLYAGSLSLSSHPVDILLDAFARISSKIPDAALLVMGAGEDYQALVNQAQKSGISRSTIFTGRVDPDQVTAYYHLADVSVDPVHDNEAARGRSPLKLFESWACGVPFVSADVGDRSYLIGDPPAGWLVKRAGDPQSLAEGIEQVLESAELAQTLCQRGLEKVENYTWDHLAGIMEQEYLKLRDGGKHR